MSDAVLLEGVRCDGQAFSGCEMSCLIFWKLAWLKTAEGNSEVNTTPVLKAPSSAGSGCTVADIWTATRRPSQGDDSAEPAYKCQATQLFEASEPLPLWKPGQYLEDFASGNVRISQILSGLIFQIYYNLVESGLGFGSALRWLYDVFQKVRGGSPYPGRRGRLQKASRTPTLKLELKVGELVRIKDYDEILDTVNESLINRGMAFHPELVPHCGKTARVQQQARKIMNEKTGRVMELKNPCVVLEGVYCIGRYTKPLFCPRDCYPYWREIWLERVEPDAKVPEGTCAVTQQSV